MDTKKTGRLIAQLRKEKGLTQSQLASGYAFFFLSYMELNHFSFDHILPSFAPFHSAILFFMAFLSYPQILFIIG